MPPTERGKQYTDGEATSGLGSISSNIDGTVVVFHARGARDDAHALLDADHYRRQEVVVSFTKPVHHKLRVGVAMVEARTLPLHVRTPPLIG